jgi:hypothetical protein
MSSTLLQFYGGRRSTARLITITNLFIIKPTRCTNFTYFGMKLYMFRTVPLSIIRSLFTVHSAVVCVIQLSKAVYKPVWHIPLLSVQWINWWWTEELSETCRISCQNKICEISASGWFYYKEICYDARSHERKITVTQFSIQFTLTDESPVGLRSLLQKRNTNN